ncbi:MAG: hypothetical protein CMB67_01885 [Euryarchaeota archaeon]|nr:hypothetical protein [Euryarchaeota archaeon]
MSGAMIAILMILLIALGEIVFEFFATAMLSFLMIILIPPFLTREIWEKQLNLRPSLKHLVPVSFMTFLFPVLGPSFGGPSLGPEWLILIPMAALGGIFWSLPFAGWDYYSSSRNPT